MPSIIQAQRTLDVNGRSYKYWDIHACAALDGVDEIDIVRLPISLKVLLENLLRHEDGTTVTSDDMRAVAMSASRRDSNHEIAFHPVRVLMPDSSGLPLLADLAAMRDAVGRLGGNPEQINPRIPVDLVIDHSVSTEHFGSAEAFARNLDNEYERNRERYAFLRWAEQAYDNFRIFPPGTGIVHQVNMELLARPVWSESVGEDRRAYPDTLVGMDSHTPMANALGVFGWGVGGIEAGAAMLGEPISMPIPSVFGCRLVGSLRPGVSAMDLALVVTERLRAVGVVGKIVEYYGPGVRNLALPDRATISNMAPEYGATMGFFPIDIETIRFLALTGRDPQDVALAEIYAKTQTLWGEHEREPVFDSAIEINLADVEPAVAGPQRPQDRRPLGAVRASLIEAFPSAGDVRGVPSAAGRPLQHGDVVIAAITSCTNTSNPASMISAGLLARNAVQRGLTSKPWVKTSLSPGSRAVVEYLDAAGLRRPLEDLGFYLAGFGCMTCAGGSGPLIEPLDETVEREDLVVTAVLSANRNFQGRIHPRVRAAYIGSPALVVSYALAGSVLTDIETVPLGVGVDGRDVFLRDIWPDPKEVADTLARVVTAGAFCRGYSTLEGDRQWRELKGATGPFFRWNPASTYLRRPPFFDESMLMEQSSSDILGARALLLLGHGVTTDDISPGGAIAKTGLVAEFLRSQGVKPADFHSFIARRINHEVMLRGTFGNSRLRNEMVPGIEGGLARHVPSNEIATVFEVAERYREEGIPVIVIAGAEYGTGSSRDWAAKGTRLLGIRAVVAESFERIHRSNLVGMGVLPLEFGSGVTRKSLGLDGSERFDLLGLASMREAGVVQLRITRMGGGVETVPLLCRVDASREWDWYHSNGVLNHALMKLARSGQREPSNTRH